MADNQKQQNQLQLQIDPKVAEGNYANLAMITHSSSDFILDFAAMFPGLPGPVVRDRVVMAPEHAKRLLAALQENIIKYERTFGEIKIQIQQPTTVAPFGGGEA